MKEMTMIRATVYNVGDYANCRDCWHLRSFRTYEMTTLCVIIGVILHSANALSRRSPIILLRTRRINVSP